MTKEEFSALSQMLHNVNLISGTWLQLGAFSFRRFKAGKQATKKNLSYFVVDGTNVRPLLSRGRIRHLEKLISINAKLGMYILIAIPKKSLKEGRADNDNLAHAFLDFLKELHLSEIGDNPKTDLFDDGMIWDLRITKTESWNDQFHFSLSLGQVEIDSNVKVLKVVDEFAKMKKEAD